MTIHGKKMTFESPPPPQLWAGSANDPPQEPSDSAASGMPMVPVNVTLTLPGHLVPEAAGCRRASAPAVSGTPHTRPDTRLPTAAARGRPSLRAAGGGRTRRRPACCGPATATRGCAAGGTAAALCTERGRRAPSPRWRSGAPAVADSDVAWRRCGLTDSDITPRRRREEPPAGSAARARSSDEVVNHW